MFDLSVEWKDLSAHINQLIFRDIETVLPIPPNQQFINFILLVTVIQEIKDTVVEMLGVGELIRTGENLSGHERKSCLYLLKLEEW